MDNPSPAAPGKVIAATEPPLTSHTVNFGTDGEPAFDQTIKVKMPGTGMVVFNRYKLQRVLGRGGMGIVWLADDLKLERPVALKFLPSLIGLDPAAVKELKTETRRGLELSHPNIVRIYDFVDDDDAAAISMEFVDGKTLSELRATTEHGIFTVEDVSRWLPGVCDALDYAHFQRKVVHRDLKPANIMLTAKDDVAKVADFGIARSLSDTMSRLSAAHIGTSGTLPYMSPQQAMGERPLPTDDVYSLGATLYELLAGKPPFYRGDLPTQINSKIPPRMAERRRELELAPNDNIPKEWEEAIAACLNKDPNLRPSCAGMLMEMLGLRPMSSTNNRTLSFATRPTGSTASAAKSKGKAALFAAAAVVAAAAGAGIWHFTQDKTPSTSASVAVAPSAEPAKNQSLPATPPESPSVAEKAAPPKASAPTVNNKAAPSAPPPADAPSVAAVTPSPAATAPAATPGSTPLAAAGTAPPMPAPDPAVPGSAPATVIPSTTPSVAAIPPAAPAPPPAAVPTAVVAQLPSLPPGAQAMAPNPELQPAAAAVPAQPDLPPGVLPPGYTPPMAAQPIVSDPPAGYWTLDQMYPTAPFATYSAPGRKYLLYRTQAALKEKGLYTSTVDGKEGKSTHNAIQLFQAKSNLKPTGLLDIPTLAALQLAAEPDNIDWSSPASIPTPPGRRSAGGGRYPPRSQEDDPNLLERTSDRLKGIFSR